MPAPAPGYPLQPSSVDTLFPSPTPSSPPSPSGPPHVVAMPSTPTKPSFLSPSSNRSNGYPASNGESFRLPSPDGKQYRPKTRSPSSPPPSSFSSQQPCQQPISTEQHVSSSPYPTSSSIHPSIASFPKQSDSSPPAANQYLSPNSDPPPRPTRQTPPPAAFPGTTASPSTSQELNSNLPGAPPLLLPNVLLAGSRRSSAASSARSSFHDEEWGGSSEEEGPRWDDEQAWGEDEAGEDSFEVAGRERMGELVMPPPLLRPRRESVEEELSNIESRVVANPLRLPPKSGLRRSSVSSHASDSEAAQESLSSFNAPTLPNSSYALAPAISPPTLPTPSSSSTSQLQQSTISEDGRLPPLPHPESPSSNYDSSSIPGQNSIGRAAASLGFQQTSPGLADRLQLTNPSSLQPSSDSHPRSSRDYDSSFVSSPLTPIPDSRTATPTLHQTAPSLDGNVVRPISLQSQRPLSFQKPTTTQLIIPSSEDPYVDNGRPRASPSFSFPAPYSPTSPVSRSADRSSSHHLSYPHQLPQHDQQREVPEYTSSPSFNNLPTSTSSTSAFASPPLSSLIDQSFEEQSFTVSYAHQEALPPILTSILATPAALASLLSQMTIRSVLNLWQAAGPREKAALERRKSREEVRVWGLAWAGYVRGGLDPSVEREGWDKIGIDRVLDFLSTLLLPPFSPIPPPLVVATSLVTLLLRTSHANLPPPGPHLIPFEEEEAVSNPTVQNAAAASSLNVATSSSNPSAPPARTRGLPSGRELVFPSPLAPGGPHPPPTNARGGHGRTPSMSTDTPRLPRRRSSSSSSIMGISWNRRRNASNSTADHLSSGPPSSFNLSSHPPSSAAASIYTTSNSSRSTLPSPQYPEPKRYFLGGGVPDGNIKRSRSRSTIHRGDGGESVVGMSAPSTRLSLDSVRVGTSVMSGVGEGTGGGQPRQNGRPSGLPSMAPLSNIPRRRGASENAASSPIASSPSTTMFQDLQAPSMPNISSDPACQKYSPSREPSLSNLGMHALNHTGNGSSTKTPSPSSSSHFLNANNPRSPLHSSHSTSLNQLARRSPSPLQRQPLPEEVGGPPEPLFLSAPHPYAYHRAPIIRIVVPLSSNVLWPSAAALKLCHRELDQSGLLSKMRLGDLVENLAVSFPIRTSTGIPSTWTTGAMVYLPPYLHPLSTAHSSPLPLPSSHTPHNEIIKLGHLPPTLDSFLLPPTYFHAVLPTPYIIHLDLSRWAREVQGSLRLANQRTEMSTVRGEVMSVEVWVHEAGFMIRGTDVGKVGPWEGSMVTLEADGTAEGREELLKRVRGPNAERKPWEIIGSKSTRGSVWLKLIREHQPRHEV